MARPVILDFTGVEPIQMTGGSDHVPAGRYFLVLRRIEDTHAASSGNRMVKAALAVEGGDYHGKRITDTFVLDTGGSVGYKRLLTFMLALGVPVEQTAVSLDFDMLVGQRCVSDLQDNLIPANGQYPERLVSRPAIYYTVDGIDPSSWMENGVLIPGAARAQKAATEAARAATPAPVVVPAPAPEPPATNGNTPAAVVPDGDQPRDLAAEEAAAKAAQAFAE